MEIKQKCRTKQQIEILKEIKELNDEIKNLEFIRNDYKSLQSEQYDRNQLYWEIQGLIKERNQLLSQL